MTYSTSPTTAETLDLGSFVDHIRASVDFESGESLFEAADAFKALANNRTFLSDWLNERLKADHSIPESGFVADVVCVAIERDFLVRANLWRPPRSHTLDAEADNLAGSYLIPHDHNFTFLTVGYVGNGYRTELYEYEPELVRGLKGEPVDLRFLGTTTLSEGKVMLYRESRDVHVQHHPSDFSISLNVLSLRRRYHNTQRFFDVTTGRISRTEVDLKYSRTAFLCRMAGLVGDDETYELLDKYARETARDPASRWHAIESCIRLRRDTGLALLERATRDPDPYVSGRASRLLEGPADDIT